MNPIAILTESIQDGPVRLVELSKRERKILAERYGMRNTHRVIGLVPFMGVIRSVCSRTGCSMDVADAAVLDYIAKL